MDFISLFPGGSIKNFIIYVLITWLIFSFILTIYLIVRMYIIEHKANDIKYGRQRILFLRKAGKFKQMPIYSMEEMHRNKKLEDVRLSVFPNYTGVRDRFVLILPGGGYAHCCTKQEGYPTAAYFNELGYTAFVLEYRTGFKCSPYGPMEDVAKALQFIEKHQLEFNVFMEDYALVGFSAGGNLASIFASDTHEHGYKALGSKRPGTVILGYPWTNVSHWAQHPYWNIWIGLLGIWLSERGFFYMFGLNHTTNKRKSLCVQYYISENYPPTFLMSGGIDMLVPASRHADILKAALDEKGIKNEYKMFFRLPHGIGIGRNTPAQNWLTEAASFWLGAIIENKEKHKQQFSILE